MRTDGLIGLVVIACISCSKSKDNPGGTSSSSAAPIPSAAGSSTSGSPSASGSSGSAAGDADLVARAEKITDACPFIAKEFVDKLVPQPDPPAGERYPVRCAVRGKPSALEVAFGPYPQADGEAIAGLGSRAALQRLDPTSKGDVYLIVILGTAVNGRPFGFSVEVAGHDGKDHKDDAVAIAKDILKRI